MLEKTVETKYALEAPRFLCVACAAEIPPGATYLSAIVFAEQGFERREYCDACRAGGALGLDQVFAFWKARRPEPLARPSKRRRFDPDLLWEFFLNLYRDLEDPGEEEAEDGPAPGGEAVGDAGAPSPEGTAAGGETAAPAARPVSRNEKTRLQFLLALLLVRSKKLLLRETFLENGREYLRLASREDDAPFAVEDPQLGRDDLERVKETLGNLLNMEI